MNGYTRNDIARMCRGLHKEPEKVQQCVDALMTTLVQKHDLNYFCERPTLSERGRNREVYKRNHIKEALTAFLQNHKFHKKESLTKQVVESLIGTFDFIDLVNKPKLQTVLI